MISQSKRLFARRLTVGVLATGTVVAGAAALAGPADAAGAVAKLSISPTSLTSASGECDTFTVTELAADGSVASSGQFTPTVTTSTTAGTFASYGTPTPGPLLGLPAACTDSKVTADATGSVFTFGVMTTDLFGTPATTTITVGDSADASITATATQNVDQPVPTGVSLAFGPPTAVAAVNTCPTTTTDPKTVAGAAQEICATVTANSGAATVPGQTVTFSVGSGTVAGTSAGALATSATKTYQAETDANGVATAFVSSTAAGAQTIEAATGTGATEVSSTPLVDTYQAAPAAALTLSPTSATIASGGSQVFTATVTDASNKPVSGVSVSFTQSGAGSISGSTVTTGAAGTASVTLSAPAGSTAAGSGSVTASAATPASATKTSTATATYTISAGTVTTKTVKAKISQTSTVKGQVMQTVKLSPALAGTKVNFFKVVNGVRKYVGHAKTNSAGKATHKIYHLKAGTTYKAQARAVGLPKGENGAFSNVDSQKVK